MIPPSPSFAALLQDFFCKRLISQRSASPRTVACYRDTFRLFLRYAEEKTLVSPAVLALGDLDAPLVLAFLDHLECDRHNSVRTRNLRLAALRSFFRYAASFDPAHLPSIQRILAIPCKRHDRPILGFLSRAEVDAVHSAVDCSTWSGRRDRALFATLYNTGARVSELVDARAEDFTASPVATLRLRGKGRKERCVPLWKTTSRLLSVWLANNPGPSHRPIFPNRGGRKMTRSGIANRLRVTVAKASTSCPSLGCKRISPHTFRHTTAMHLLQAGIDITVIALWLGHESQTTTHGYVEADLAMKKHALDKLTPPATKRDVFKPGDKLLAFLDAL